jgi:hypothetical protein
MTTTIHVAVSGNKQVQVSTQQGTVCMQPGAHQSFVVYGDGEIKVREFGDFVAAPTLPLVRPVEDGASVST